MEDINFFPTHDDFPSEILYLSSKQTLHAGTHKTWTPKMDPENGLPGPRKWTPNMDPQIKSHKKGNIHQILDFSGFLLYYFTFATV